MRESKFAGGPDGFQNGLCKEQGLWGGKGFPIQLLVLQSKTWGLYDSSRISESKATVTIENWFTRHILVTFWWAECAVSNCYSRSISKYCQLYWQVVVPSFRNKTVKTAY